MAETVLVTGFEPFLQWTVNSSGEVARALGARMPDSIRAEVLPVDHAAAHRRMTELVEEVRPKVCLAMGLWAGSTFRIERYGRRCPGLGHIEGADELEGAWDWVEMERQFSDSGKPVIHSHDAGKYVCDTTYWSVLDFRRRHGFPERAAFLHVPPLSEVWTVEEMTELVGKVIEGASGAKPQATAGAIGRGDGAKPQAAWARVTR
jgi:pyroglutamyl-peptidase